MKLSPARLAQLRRQARINFGRVPHKKQTKKVFPMARRRRSRYRIGKRGQSSNSFLSRIPPELKTFGYGFLYSAVVREPTEKLMRSVANDSLKLNLSDNAIRIGTAVLGRRLLGKYPMAREVFDVAIATEGAAAGKAGFNGLSSLFSNMGNGSSPSTQSTTSTPSNGASFE